MQGHATQTATAALAAAMGAPDNPHGRAAQKAQELVTEARACELIGGIDSPIHRSTLWRGIKAGRYPHPVRISTRKCRWLASELLAVIDRASAQREPGKHAA